MNNQQTRYEPSYAPPIYNKLPETLPKLGQSQTRDQMDSLANVLEQLHKELSQLEERLTPVLYSMEPAAHETPCQPMPVLAPLANDLRIMVDKVAQAIFRIDKLTRSLQL